MDADKNKNVKKSWFLKILESKFMSQALHHLLLHRKRGLFSDNFHYFLAAPDTNNFTDGFTLIPHPFWVKMTARQA
jgi:hypothetical protein